MTSWVVCERGCGFRRVIGQMCTCEAWSSIAKPAARPVKVGDMVFDSRGDRARPVGQCNLSHPAGPWLVIGDPMHPSAWSDAVENCRHADGAPIDVPATLAALAKPEPRPTLRDVEDKEARMHALVAKDYEAFAVDIASKFVVEAQKKRIAELEALCELHSGEERREYERANRLSDKAGALAADLREAQAIIGQKQTEIERLQRVIRGKR